MNPPTLSFILYAAAFTWCAALLGTRMAVTGSPYYLFLAWNLFLACIPLVLSFGLRTTSRWLFALPLLALWLLFFPNAPHGASPTHAHTPPMPPTVVKYAFVARGADVLAETPGAPDAPRHRAVGQSCLDRCPPGGDAAR